MKKYGQLCDVMIALLCAMVVLTSMGLLRKCAQIDAETRQVEQIMAQAQKRIDDYNARQPARERPVVVVTQSPTAPPEPSVPAWYIESCPLDMALQAALLEACMEFGVPYSIALAVIERETDFRNISGDGGSSIGYFQIQPRWWVDLMEEIGVDDLTDPAQNFRTGCAILDRLFRQFGSWQDALTAYNSGSPGESGYASAVLAAERGRGLAWPCTRGDDLRQRAGSPQT